MEKRRRRRWRRAREKWIRWRDGAEREGDREERGKEDVEGDPVSVAEFLAPSNQDDHKGSSLPLRLKLLPPYLGDAASLLQPFLVHTLTSTAAAALSLLP